MNIFYQKNLFRQNVGFVNFSVFIAYIMCFVFVQIVHKLSSCGTVTWWLWHLSQIFSGKQICWSAALRRVWSCSCCGTSPAYLVLTNVSRNYSQSGESLCRVWSIVWCRSALDRQILQFQKFWKKHSNMWYLDRSKAYFEDVKFWGPLQEHVRKFNGISSASFVSILTRKIAPNIFFF